MGVTGDTLVTPGRRTHIRFDVDEYTVWEPPYLYQRGGNDIRPNPNPAAPATEHVQHLVSGAWALESVQDNISNVRERTDNDSAVVPLSDLTTIDGYATVPRWRYPSDLTGFPAAGTDVASTGDNFLVLRVPAGTDWGASLSDDVSAYGQPTPPTGSNNVDMARHAVGNVTYPAEQPFYLRYGTVGTTVDAPDYHKTFYFGGPSSVYGEGQYALMLSGSGFAVLYERVSDEAHGTQAWKLRTFWKYCETGRVAGASHTMRVWPHRGPSGGFLEFTHYATNESAGGGLVQRYLPKAQAPTSHLFTFQFPRPPAPVREHVTGPGPIRVDVRKDLRPQWQVSLLRFLTDGYLTDSPFMLPFNPTARGLITLYWQGIVPTGTSIVAAIYDAATNTELATPTVGANYVSYPMPNNTRHFYARFTFHTDDRSVTPLLWSYTVQRDGYIGANAPGEWTGGLLQRVEVSGPESDPSHETAMLEIEDPGNALTTLRVRGMVPVQVETEYDLGDTSLRSVLFRGYAARTVAHKKGLAGSTYPDPEWRRYQLNCVGMWTRLQETLYEGRWVLIDPTTDDGTGSGLPYKITDVVRLLLAYAGFPDTMIDVPDLPVRFFPSVGNNESLMIAPLTNVFEFVTRTLRDYLGAFLVWDANAGTLGMWRVQLAPTAPYNNLAAFLTAPPGAGITTRPETYGSTNWVGTPTAFIRKGTLDTSVKPPEANHVLVVGAGQATPNADGSYLLSQWAVNALSYNAFTDGSGVTIETADPTHPDYLGRRVPLYVVDPNLQTQEAVDWVCRRIYDVACHAIKVATFDAPLVLVVDATDALQAAPRPLRYYDAVTVNGAQWLVRNVNPSYRRDGVQMARYELEAPRI